MQIFLIIKCGVTDAFNFITQLSQLQAVEKVTVFRDSASFADPKISYILPRFKGITFLKTAGRFFQILKRKKLSPGLIIGIYEIPHGLLAVLTARILKVPSVVSIIGNPGYKKLRKGFRLSLTLWILRNCDYVTVTGTNSREVLVRKGIENKKIFILPNTLDFRLFEGLSLNKKYDLISLGRITGEKHLDVFVELIAILKKQNPEIKGAIGGTGPQLRIISDLVKRLDLVSNIDIKGFVPEKDLVTFFNLGKIFVLTSETEGFPRTIIQAASCGIPVVASRVGDIDDVIDHNINGFLIDDYRNIAEYAERAVQLLNDSTLYNSFSERLNRKVRMQFIVENASSVWNEILNKVSQS